MMQEFLRPDRSLSGMGPFAQELDDERRDPATGDKWRRLGLWKGKVYWYNVTFAERQMREPLKLKLDMEEDANRRILINSYFGPATIGTNWLNSMTRGKVIGP